MKTLHWTIHDLEFLPDDGNTYEIIDRELYVSGLPDWEHQSVCGNLLNALKEWDRKAKTGKANFSPGIIYSDDTNLVPDVIWISRERLNTALQKDGKLHNFAELMVEVLSPGAANEQRDRGVKLKLYSRHNVLEYWVVNWHIRSIEIYRRVNAVLILDRTLNETDILESPLLPGFRCPVSQIFEDL